MKKIYFLLAFCLGFAVNAQIVNIPDANFKAKLLLASPTQSIAYNAAGTKIKIDVNNDGEIQASEALLVYRLVVGSSSVAGNIVDLTGIESFTNLKTLTCLRNQLTSLDVSPLTNLENLNCNQNNLTSLNITGLTTLKTLYCSTNSLTSLDVSNNPNLLSLGCSTNLLTNLDISNCFQITDLVCFTNQLSTLDVSNRVNLTYLSCYSNLITNLNISNCLSLTELNCYGNQLTNLDISNRPNLIYLNCTANSLTSLNIANDTALTYLTFNNNQLQHINLDSLVNLETLALGENPYTSVVNLSALTNLTQLFIENMSSTAVFPLTDSVMPSLTSLDVLKTDGSPIGNFNYNLLPNITFILCRNTGLTSMATIPTDIKMLVVEANQLTSIDLTPYTDLEVINFYNNPIDNLIIGNHPLLNTIYAGKTNLTAIDFSGLPALNSISTANSMNLTNLNIKNGLNSVYNNIANCPILQYICADDSEIITIQNSISTNGYTNCHVNTYCTFEPGGIFYTIQGNHKFDIDNNGCDANDYLFSNMKFNITSGTNTTTLISGDDGNFHYDVPSGSYTITPEPENPSYYTISPTTASVTFPTSASPFNQNFCFASNAGADLQIVILPINVARPGFENQYKIIYKNAGGTPLNGTVNFTFEDTINDLVESIPSFTSQSVNNLSWNFSNLLPFQTSEIILKFDLNSPTDNPAVTGGDILHFTASVSSSFTDLTPNNNTFVYNQTVVNSFDPNDKTCLEGTTITPDKVGEYVHYMIRFENTGSANAQNIVVKDIIDTTKFDVATLIPIDGSHEFYTRITNTNQVEFIFENIQLPFDDDNNDGYVVFKIKTKSDLTVGSSFSNTANIYFDYNFPIITNTATTVIQALSNPDFEFSNYIQLTPNPAKDVLNITSKMDIEISSISIYNSLGQLVLVIPNANETASIDVSQLTSGTYFVKVLSDKGSSNSKFIKQ